MKYFRFMSIEEFKKLLNNEELINNTVHKAFTNSVGFCFMRYNEEPEEAYEYLSGIVSNNVCAVFETKKRLKKTYGIYADPYGYFFDTVTNDEYCTKKYNLKDFKIVKFAIPKYKGKWKWYTDIDTFFKDIEYQKKKEKKENKRRQKIKESKEEYRKKLAKKFEKFIKEVNSKRKVEIKIDDKFYNFGAQIDSLECDNYNDILTMKIII